MKKHDVAVTIQNMVQFYNMKPGIDAMIKAGLSVDIYIPQIKGGWADMYEDTFTRVDSGYNIYRSDQEIDYKILLEPYPMDILFKFHYKYRLKYKYGALCAKPSVVYHAKDYICYDGLLCNGPYEAGYLKTFAQTFIIGNMKYSNFHKKKEEHGKPVLLYLPTYGRFSSLKEVAGKLDSLKEKYYIIIKYHHGVLAEHENIYETDQKCDEWYDHKTELTTLLERADVVLSDNSGSIFEAIYADVPVAIFSSEINESLDEFYTTQYDLVQKGVIPYTDNVEYLSDILEKALSDEYIKKQEKVRAEYFYIPENQVADFMTVINKFMKDEINIRYKQLHDIFSRDYMGKKELAEKFPYVEQEAKSVREKFLKCCMEKEECERKLSECERKLSYYENGKLYRLMKKVYSIAFKILGR